MKLSKELIKEIEKEIEGGFISKVKHDDFDLYILNYTNKCQINWRWSEASKICRGLIVDANYKVRARSYRKFFTLDQIENSGCDELPPTGIPYIVSPKKDGFLGVLYFGDDGIPYMSSRGSFNSDMAVKANEMLRTTYKNVEFDKNYSYVFEIVYPNTLLTLEYGYEALILHGVFDNESGKEIPIHKFEGFSKLLLQGLLTESIVEISKEFKGIDDFMERYKFNNDEGYVLTFDNGYKLKVKFEEYKQMSRVKNSLGNPGSTRFIDNVINGTMDLNFLKNKINNTEILKEIDKVHQTYDDIFRYVTNEYDVVIGRIESNNIKSFAIDVRENYSAKIGSALISYYTGDINKLVSVIWKTVKEKLQLDALTK
jgi:hypothetical protein